MREIIFFIAYSAMGKTGSMVSSRFNQAKNFLFAILFIHTFQLLLILNKGFSFLDIRQLNEYQYLALIFLLSGGMFMIDFIFPRRLLAKAIKNNVHKWISRYAKLVAYSYLFGNIMLTFLGALYVYK